MAYWLMKSEPAAFSIDDLMKSPKQTAPWDGVRNYQVRNWIRDKMRKGDQAFFYHSSCDVPGIVGIMEVVSDSYPDHTAFDAAHHHFDPKSDREHPRWYCIDMHFVKKFTRIISLKELKEHEELRDMPLLKKGNRLSILPMSSHEWQSILKLGSVD